VVLDRNPVNYHAEVEQVAFGTGVLVDGIDFSDDKLLQGRTFAYSDTQRYRVGPNYLQLPINAPRCPVRDQPVGRADGSPRLGGRARRRNPHVNYEPSSRGGLRQQERAGRRRAPTCRSGRPPTALASKQLQAGGRPLPQLRGVGARGLIDNLVDALCQCEPDIRSAW
jgi:catalase